MKRTLMIICVLLLMMEANSFWGRRRRRRRAAPPPCSAVDCLVSSWTSWSSCSHQCGTSGTQTRTRRQTRVASCGGRCPFSLRQTRACNRDTCQNGGTPHSRGCSCHRDMAERAVTKVSACHSHKFFGFVCQPTT